MGYNPSVGIGQATSGVDRGQGQVAKAFGQIRKRVIGGNNSSSETQGALFNSVQTVVISRGLEEARLAEAKTEQKLRAQQMRDNAAGVSPIATT